MNDICSAKARAIKLCVFDVDGVLTDGGLYYTAEGETIKRFNVQDGLGLVRLREANIPIAIISCRRSDALTRRLNDLQITHVYTGVKEKLPALQSLLTQLNLTENETACMGDDLPDLPLLTRAGFSIAPANAVPAVKQHVDFCTQATGGHGAVREACDFILSSKGFTITT